MSTHPSMELFLNVFLAYNREHYKNDQRVLDRLNGLTMENVSFNDIVETPIGNVFGRSLSLVSDSLQLSALGQLYLRAKLTFDGIHDDVPVYDTIGEILALQQTGLFLSYGGTYNIIPIMSQNIQDGYSVATSSVYAGDNGPWHVFDQNLETVWTSSDTTVPRVPQWVSIALPTAQTIRAYAVRGRVSGWINNPRTFTLQGSDNDTNWVDINTDGLPNNNPNQFKVITLPNEVTYKHYRLFISLNYIDWGASTICELELLGATLGFCSVVSAGSITNGTYLDQVKQQVLTHFSFPFNDADYSVDTSGDNPIVTISTPTIIGNITVYEET